MQSGCENTDFVGVRVGRGGVLLLHTTRKLTGNRKKYLIKTTVYMDTTVID
jgi:hypothetical protein